MTEGSSTRPVNIEDEMRRSYLDYSMSVIIGRALPDVRDGLKPVHRRVLFAMQDLGNTAGRAYKKSARIVGDVIGKYHPHGDQAVYDTLVRLAQDFSLRYPLVDGQGNFGSIDGDRAAAMRYTEVRMERLASDLLADIDKKTVDFGPNYDETLEEPLILPARFPNLLVNGASGIAVGMATNIPPHNMREVIDATMHLIDHPDASVTDLMRFVKGPDFPTGGILLGVSGARQAYETGRGSVKVRAKTEVEIYGKKEDRERIVVTEIPYYVNKAKLIEKIAELVRDKKLTGISDLRDESDRDGMRIVIELKRDAMADVVRNNLFKQTQLQTTFGITMLAIDQGQPKVLTLKECIARFIDHRREVVTRRCRFELEKAEARFHVLAGLVVATDHIDRVVEIIRGSRDPDEAKALLVAEKFKGFEPRFAQLVDAHDAQIDAAIASGIFQLDAIQAQAILEMRLSRLTGLEREKLEAEMLTLRDEIVRLKEILAHDRLLLNEIIGELKVVREQYGDERRTQIKADVGEIAIEDLIADEDMVVTVSHAGYIKRIPLDEYRSQKRGGRGKTGASVKQEDFVEQLIVASTHTQLLLFTSHGRCHWLKVHEIPAASRAARGKPVVNLISMRGDERLRTVLPIESFDDEHFIAMFTHGGYVKKTALSAFANQRQGGIIALTIDEGDDLITAQISDGKSEMLVTTAGGLSIRFSEDQVRPMGRTARGVRAIALGTGDQVVSAEVLRSDDPILSITENGYGKRTALDEYRTQSRGGKGIITIKTTDRNGPVVGAVQVKEDAEIILITNTGMLIRMATADISIIGRNTQGVRLISLGSREEKVTGVAPVVETEMDDEGDEGGEEEGA
ncbi:MAG: DNA gyrase subunit A [Deltaproteobacteria bacterium]|nr:DNA gyrase subunit A [Deltaproteobacteria bacterium]